MLRYSRTLPVIRVEGKVTLHQVLQRLAVALLGAALLAASPDGSRADDAGAAAAFLVSLKDQVIEQLTDESLPVTKREQNFRDLFRAYFDFQAIGRFVLGRYWRKAQPEVRKDFLFVFEEIMVQRFVSTFAGYADTRFEVIAVQALKREGLFKITSKIAPTEDEIYLVGWLVGQRNGKFRILDVVAEGVSMALTLRSEYASVIKHSDGRVKGLVAQLRELIKDSSDTQATNDATN